METKVKKREWVKNAAIIFLSILLILTFFSNTIMNASLPEVATKNIMSGSIVSKIRVTGTVEANQNYEVSINQSREVSAVMVKVDQQVSAGDVLFTLADTQSTEVEAAEEALRQLNLQYQRALINAADTDYARENRDIKLAREALAEAEAERDKLYVSEGDINRAKENVKAYEDEVKFCEDRLKEAQKDLEELGGLVSPEDSALETMRRALDAKYEELVKAEDDISTARLIYGVRYDRVKSLAKLVAKIDGKKFNEDNDSSGSTQEVLAVYMPFIIELMDTSRIVDVPAEKVNEAIVRDPANEDKYNELFAQYLEEITVISGDRYTYEEYSEAYSEISNCSETYKKLKDEYSVLKKEYDDARKSDNSNIYNEYNEEVKAAQEELEEASAILEDAKAELLELEGNKSKYDSAVDQVKSCEKTLEDLLFALQEQQKSDDKAAQLENLDLQDLISQINKQKEEIEKLSTDALGKEIVANVSGIVRNIYITAGNTTTPGSALAVIEIPDMGYTLSSSVTNEQARKVHTGDTASVSNYYWGSQIDATLKAIKPDPKNPQSNKILEFEIQGDVTVGSNLTLSVGARNADYDYVVPNSAIKSDSNGSFILVVVADTSPLGNKYTATRVDVTVLASDETNTAVSGGINAGDFVITTSNKPISNGDRVRMPDELS